MYHNNYTTFTLVEFHLSQQLNSFLHAFAEKYVLFIMYLSKYTYIHTYIYLYYRCTYTYNHVIYPLQPLCYLPNMRICINYTVIQIVGSKTCVRYRFKSQKFSYFLGCNREGNLFGTSYGIEAKFTHFEFFLIHYTPISGSYQRKELGKNIVQLRKFMMAMNGQK